MLLPDRMTTRPIRGQPAVEQRLRERARRVERVGVRQLHARRRWRRARARNVRSGACAAQCSSRSVIFAGYGPSGTASARRLAPSGLVLEDRRRDGKDAVSHAAIAIRGTCRRTSASDVEQRRRRPAIAELAMERDDASCTIAEAGAIRVEHRAAAPGGEAVAIQVDDVDVRRARSAKPSSSMRAPSLISA